MAKRLEFRISAELLLLGVLITVVPISLVSLYASTTARVQAERSAGVNLQTITESIALRVAEVIRGKVIEAALIASDAAVREGVAASNKRFADFSSEQMVLRLRELDEVWNTPQGESAVAEMLASPASQTLRRKLTVDPTFLRITVTDSNGATVAATHKTVDYFQADEDYWRDIYSEGSGGVSLTDALYDEATKTYYLGVGVPVVDDTNEFVGTLDALVEISALFPIVRRTDLGSSGYAALVKTDGTVIVSSDGTSVAERVIPVEYEAFQDTAGSFRGRSAGHFQAEFGDRGNTLLAFAGVGLADEFQQLDWMVVASQDASEVLGTTSGAQFLIIGIALLSLASVVFLTVYFKLHAQSEIEEMEE